MTGSYHNHFRIFNRETAQNVTLEASRDAIEGPTHVLTPIQVFSGTCEIAPQCPLCLNDGQ